MFLNPSRCRSRSSLTAADSPFPAPTRSSCVSDVLGHMKRAVNCSRPPGPARQAGPTSAVRTHPEEHLPLEKAVEPVILGNFLAGQVMAVAGVAGGQLGIGVAARKILGAGPFDVILELHRVLEDHATFCPFVDEVLEAAQEPAFVDR